MNRGENKRYTPKPNSKIKTSKAPNFHNASNLGFTSLMPLPKP